MEKLYLNRIKNIRVYSGISQEHLAKTANVSISTLRYIEDNKCKFNYKISTVVKLLHAFRQLNKNLKEIDIGYLFEK